VCGRVDDVPLPPLPEVEEAVKQVVDYQLTGMRLECTGVCPRCRGAAATSPPGGVPRV
jgi:Fe2+ or Zn2+ uptake regulation protein